MGAYAGTKIGAQAADEAWISGANGFVARTVDGGATWQQESLPGGAGASFESLRVLDPERGWVGGPGIWHRDVPYYAALVLRLRAAHAHQAEHMEH